MKGAPHPDRNAQFEHTNARVKDFQQRGQPVVSVDTKKKERVGDFANGGRDYQPKGSPERVRVYDFIDKHCRERLERSPKIPTQKLSFQTARVRRIPLERRVNPLIPFGERQRRGTTGKQGPSYAVASISRSSLEGQCWNVRTDPLTRTPLLRRHV